MKITILYKNKRLFNVSMHNDMSVNRLREIIEELRHIPTDKQTLTFNGYVLENGRLLMQDYGATDQSKITLSLPIDFEPNIKIYIKVPGGQVIKRVVNRNQFVSSLKWSIKDSTKIPVNVQALSYGSWLMEDDVKLGDYNLQHGSVIRVLRRPNSSQNIEIHSTISRTHSAEENGNEKLVSMDGTVHLKAESICSHAGTAAEKNKPKRPSPIKRLEITKISGMPAGGTNPTLPNEVEKIEPTLKLGSSNLSEKRSDDESLRLNLPDTEIYRHFRQALGAQMAQNEKN